MKEQTECVHNIYYNDNSLVQEDFKLRLFLQCRYLCVEKAFTSQYLKDRVLQAWLKLIAPQSCTTVHLLLKCLRLSTQVYGEGKNCAPLPPIELRVEGDLCSVQKYPLLYREISIKSFNLKPVRWWGFLGKWIVAASFWGTSCPGSKLMWCMD